MHNPLIYVLLAAGAVTLAFGEFVDAGVIVGVVVLNAVIGYVQESRAQRALDALSRMVPAEATVVRDGVTWRSLPPSWCLATLLGAEAQLIVVGSRGRGALTGVGLGSVSQPLLHRAACPVAVARTE